MSHLPTLSPQDRIDLAALRYHCHNLVGSDKDVRWELTKHLMFLSPAALKFLRHGGFNDCRTCGSNRLTRCDQTYDWAIRMASEKEFL